MDKANINAMIYNMANPFYIFSVQYFINSFFIINLNIYRWWWYWKQAKVTAFDVWWWVEVQKVCLMNENMILWFDIKDDIIFEVLRHYYMYNKHIIHLCFLQSHASTLPIAAVHHWSKNLFTIPLKIHQFRKRLELRLDCYYRRGM